MEIDRLDVYTQYVYMIPQSHHITGPGASSSSGGGGNPGPAGGGGGAAGNYGMLGRVPNGIAHSVYGVKAEVRTVVASRVRGLGILSPT